jgi:hypothetical protein
LLKTRSKIFSWIKKLIIRSRVLDSTTELFYIIVPEYFCVEALSCKKVFKILMINFIDVCTLLPIYKFCKAIFRKSNRLSKF